MRHLLGELALTPARQSRHYFPKQGRGTTTGLGCRRCEPLLALSSKPSKFLADHHTQAYATCHGTVRTKTSNPARTGLTGRLSKHAPAWERIHELHAMRFLEGR